MEVKSKKTDSSYIIEVCSLFVAVLIDTLPKNGVDAFFIHTEPKEKASEKSLLQSAADYYNKGLTKYIVLNGLLEETFEKINIPCTGYIQYKKILVKLGVNPKHILGTPEARHTGEESLFFLQLAKKMNWKKVIISAHPYHQLRCFMTIIAAMKIAGFHPMTYNKSHAGVLWNTKIKKDVLGGGVVQGNLSDHVSAEIGRIEKYSLEPKLSKNGEPTYTRHATIVETVNYLTNRDK